MLRGKHLNYNKFIIFSSTKFSSGLQFGRFRRDSDGLLVTRYYPLDLAVRATNGASGPRGPNAARALCKESQT